VAGTFERPVWVDQPGEVAAGLTLWWWAVGVPKPAP
jgi:hypothetical protein